MKRVGIALLALVLSAAIGSAHVVVRPAESKVGQAQKYTMRVPTEKQVPTTSVELTFPAGITVTTVDELQGWKLTVKKNAQGRIESASWIGSLPPREVAEFTFTAKNPESPAVVEWKAIQVFADGSKSEWTGAEGARTPASRTKIVLTAETK